MICPHTHPYITSLTLVPTILPWISLLSTLWLLCWSSHKLFPQPGSLFPQVSSPGRFPLSLPSSLCSSVISVSPFRATLSKSPVPVVDIPLQRRPHCSPWHLVCLPKGKLPMLQGLFFLIFGWRIMVLQRCVGFCHTTMWISRKYTYIPSLLNLPPTLPSREF